MYMYTCWVRVSLVLYNCWSVADERWSRANKIVAIGVYEMYFRWMQVQLI